MQNITSERVFFRSHHHHLNNIFFSRDITERDENRGDDSKKEKWKK
jgi:hypothetical protein